MAQTSQILKETRHRPWPLPQGSWQFYQEWNHALFLHWEVPFEVLRPLVPASLELDSHEGKYFVSVVPFLMQGLKPKILPSWSVVSDFYEINVRTYVKHKDKAGVYFLSIEAQKAFSAYLARTLSGLPYRGARIQRQETRWLSHNPQRGFRMDVSWQPGPMITDKSPLDFWLTERYCLYHFDNRRTWIFEIHHREWKLYKPKVEIGLLHYPLNNFTPDPAALHSSHFSPGVQVLTWPRKRING